MVMFCIYECGKKFCTSTFERACAAEEMTIRQIKEILESSNSDTKELHSTNQYLRTYIDSVKKEIEAYP